MDSYSGWRKTYTLFVVLDRSLQGIKIQSNLLQEFFHRQYDDLVPLSSMKKVSFQEAVHPLQLPEADFIHCNQIAAKFSRTGFHGVSAAAAA